MLTSHYPLGLLSTVEDIACHTQGVRQVCGGFERQVLKLVERNYNCKFPTVFWIIKLIISYYSFLEFKITWILKHVTVMT